MWQNQMTSAIPPSATLFEGFAGFNAAGDNEGGLVFVAAPGIPNNGNLPEFVTDFDGLTGQQKWTYSPSGMFYVNFTNPQFAVGTDNSIYIVENNFDSVTYTTTWAQVDKIDGNTGNLSTTFSLPLVTELTHYGPSPCPEKTYTEVGNYSAPVVTRDGSVYIEASGGEWSFSFCVPLSGSQNEPFTLMQILPNGTVQSQMLDSSVHNPGDQGATPDPVGEVVPDGQGGVLASWESLSWSGDLESPTQSTPMIADVSSGGVTKAPLPTLNWDSELIDSGSGIVVSDKATAFVSDGLSVIALSIPALQTNWTYTATPGDDLSFSAATRGGGVAVEDDQEGLIQFDSNGIPSTPVPGFSPWSPWALGMWPMISNNVLAFVYGPDVVIADSDFPQSSGSGNQNRKFKRPTIAHFIPGPPGVGANGTEIAAQEGIKVEVPPTSVQHLFYLGTNANVPSFQYELAKPISAVGFIGHSLDISVQPPLPPSTFAVGLLFTDANQALVRKPQPTDNPIYTFVGTNIQLFQVTQIKTQAKVIFIGACVISPFFENLWNIVPTSSGQVMIVPQDPNLDTNLIHATVAWENILQDLTNGQTVGQAIAQTNTYMKSQNYPERWQGIGDLNVTLK
jgi:hypothetical protein